MNEIIYIRTPLTDDVIKSLHIGDIVHINGIIYTARDAAHKRLVKMIENGEELPFPLKGQIVYYAGPTPARPGQVIGSIGPTTSGRMDKYSPVLVRNGLKAMIGKGERSETVVNEIKKNGGIYFSAIGGAGALMSGCVKESRTIAFDDLGTEAIRQLKVENFPVIVTIDCL